MVKYSYSWPRRNEPLTDQLPRRRQPKQRRRRRSSRSTSKKKHNVFLVVPICLLWFVYTRQTLLSMDDLRKQKQRVLAKHRAARLRRYSIMASDILDPDYPYAILSSEEPEPEQVQAQVPPQRKDGKDQADKNLVIVQPNDPVYTGANEWDLSPIVMEKYKLIFFTQAKVGCTVWKKLFRRMMGYPDWRLENCCGMLPWNPQSNGLTYLSHYDVETATRLLNDPNYTKAIFVRDPKERFVSAYLDKAVKNEYFLHGQCCPRREGDKDCWDRVELAKASLSGFLKLTERCDNAHWRPQNLRMPISWWRAINFVGHMDTVYADARELLERIGAWEDFGSSGWGMLQNEPIFHSNAARHATSASDRLREMLTTTTTTTSSNYDSSQNLPTLEQDIERLYRDDYEHPVLNFTRKRYTF